MGPPGPMIGGGPGVHVHMAPPIRMDGTQGFPGAPGAAPASPHSVLSIMPGPEDKLTTMFVSGITDGVSDENLINVLKACGKLKSWKRVMDPQGKPKGFGFVVYTDPEDVLAALRIFNGEGEGANENGVELPGPDGTPAKRLMVKIDAETRKLIEQYQANRMQDSDREGDENRLAEIQEAINKMKGEDVDDFLKSIADAGIPKRDGSPNGTADDGSFIKLEDLNDLPPDFPAEQRELVTREIALFRDRAAQKDKERKEREERETMERLKREEHEREKEKKRVQQQMGHDASAEEIGRSRRLSRKEEEQEWERTRAARRQTLMEENLKEREKRWLHQEEDRAKKRAAVLKGRQEHFQNLEKKKNFWTTRLAEWDDDVESEKREEKYYRDHQAWLNMRRHMRQREMKMDADHRKAEEHEIEMGQRVPEGEEAIREEREASPPPVVVGRIMTKEERQAAIQALISQIPADREGLFAWPVRWDYLDEASLAILREFTGKKIMEYLQEEEQELVNFVMDKIKNRTSAEALVVEMTKMMEEEAADLFVKKLWRRVVYETESRAQGL
ncbi:hypothetical protein HK104_006943 [Borealophlyctis nickersoniae]|nr:hypothetical protein HK104_006943 [Borealophlyctis nickersoniae]